MPHRRRRDNPGDWFHVINRAIARRTMFENGEDIELFLDQLGATAAAGWLEVHSYTVLSTHFHLLVRSPVGEMPSALHRLQLNYSRYFNRTRKRDGPLLRGRYRSRLVDSDAYRRALVAYIDANATSAGLAHRPDDYAFGSCRAYVWGGGPDWLTRCAIESDVAALTGARFDGARYVDVFGRGFTPAQRELVERRILSGVEPGEPADDLLGGGSAGTADWLQRKATLADGTSPGVAIVPADCIDAAVAATGIAPPTAVPRALRFTPWPDAARAVLLADMAGHTQHEIATRMGIGRDSARRLVLRGRQAIATDRAFAERLGSLGHEAAKRTFGHFLPPNPTPLRPEPTNDAEICAG